MSSLAELFLMSTYSLRNFRRTYIKQDDEWVTLWEDSNVDYVHHIGGWSFPTCTPYSHLQSIVPTSENQQVQQPKRAGIELLFPISPPPPEDGLSSPDRKEGRL